MADTIQLGHEERILFIGDSITDAGRLEPVYEPFGNGYVNFTANALLAKYPTKNLAIINRGISGNTTRDLDERWEKDCLMLEPSILSIMIGINDVWRQFDSGGDGAVMIDEYEQTYDGLLSQVRRKFHPQIIMMEPFLFCGDKTDEFYLTVRRYIDVVRKLADQYNALLVGLQDKIDDLIRQVPSSRWANDMVHPYPWAHCWISQQWLKATGL